MLNVLHGKSIAYLYGLKQVAHFRPQEATHLVRIVFDKGDLKTRIAALRTVVFSKEIGDGKLIGDFFVKLMAATTKEEREEIVEPFIESMLYKTTQATKPIQRKLAWLHAYYHGWKEETAS